MGAYLAAELNSPYASGLATAALLADDVTDHSLTPVDGEIEVRRILPSVVAIEKLQADETTRSTWLGKLNRVLL